MKQILLFPLLFISYFLTAQDQYHTTIENKLLTEYGLQNGQWVFFNDEVQNLDIDYLYGATDIIPLTTTTEEFSQITNIYNATEGSSAYDGGWGIPNQQTIQQGDNCLLVINLRKTNSTGKVNILCQAANNSTFEEIFTVALQNEWTQYFVPFQASINYGVGEFIAGLALAWEIQEIEVAGMNVLNFGTNYTLDQLPRVYHNDRYEGYEVNAPWRGPAQDRIEQFRKANLSVNITDTNNQPLNNATVSVRMLKPEFNWGMEIALNRIAGNIDQNNTYEEKLLNLDGEGHRFEWVVPGNSFKWPGWEENWMTSKPEKVNAVQWLKDNNLNIRMHTLAWPGWVPSPVDIEQNENNPQYIKNRITNWIDEIVTYPGLENAFDEYDVLNEPTTWRDFETAFANTPGYTTGRELYTEIMDQLQSLEPNKPQIINDYVTISQQQIKGAEYDYLKNTIQEIVDAGAPLGGIGFQSHIGVFPNSIYEVEETLTDFATQFNVPLKITEYDVDANMGDDVAAQYLEDFLTIVYSIPQVETFMFWGFWDGYHYRNSGNFFDLNWNQKPAAQAAFDKIFGEWWTEETISTNQNGLALFRPFKGEYEIVITYNGEEIIDTINLIDDQIINYQIGAPQSCAVPVYTSTNVISGNVVKINWTAVDGADKYRVRYRESGTSSWTEVSNTINYRFLNQLQLNTTYQFQLKANCVSENSVWSPTNTFTTGTDNCNYPLMTPTLSNMTSANATISWSTNPNDLKYKIKYKIVGGPWVEQFTNVPSVALSGLIMGSTYKYKLKSKCLGGWTNWTQKYTFNTPTTISPLTEEKKVIITEETITLNIAPNPFSTTTYLNLTLEKASPLSITIFDLSGRVVSNLLQDTFLETGEHRIEYSPKDLQNGVYLCVIKTDTAQKTVQLIYTSNNE